jgi:Transglutaminase-like superfamily
VPFSRTAARAASFRSRLAAWSASAPGERRQFLRAALLLPAVAFSLRVIGLRRTRGWLDRAVTSRTPPSDEQAALRAALTAVRRAQAHGLVAGACLTRSLVLQHLLARAGLVTELRFGARRDVAHFEAHAWIERDGVAIGEPRSVMRSLAPLQSTTAGPASHAASQPKSTA